MGFFRDPFDLNGDGNLDAGERFLEFMIFNEVMNEDGEEVDEKESWFGDIDDL